MHTCAVNVAILAKSRLQPEESGRKCDVKCDRKCSTLPPCRPPLQIIFQKSRFRTKKIGIFFNPGQPQPFRNHKSRHFSHENRALRGCWDLNPCPSSHAYPSLPLHLTLVTILDFSSSHIILNRV
jgi:hypothetical protein